MANDDDEWIRVEQLVVQGDVIMTVCLGKKGLDEKPSFPVESTERDEYGDISEKHQLDSTKTYRENGLKHDSVVYVFNPDDYM